jgi:hypothetical protein
VNSRKGTFALVRKSLDFVITGCPRSGTRYLARVLTALGYDCDHEACFNPWQVVLSADRPETRIWGDSSWMAVPFLEELPAETDVIHIVREPVRTMNSMLGTGQIDWGNDYRDFLAAHVWGDGLYWPRDVRQAAQEVWFRWNEWIENSRRVRLRIQVERARESLEDLVDVLEPGRKLSPSDLIRVNEIPTDENARPSLTPATLSSADLIPRCRELASGYGYSY